jgi:hypothetical protein
MNELQSTLLFRATPGSRFHGLYLSPTHFADGALQTAHRPACCTLENPQFDTFPTGDMLL